VNDSLCTHLGYDRQAVAGKAVGAMYRSSDNERIMREVRRVIAGEIKLLRIPLQRKDGTLIPVSTNFSIVNDPLGDYIIGVSSNISNVSLVKDRFYQIFKSTPVAMAVTDKVSGMFTDVNDSFLKAFQFSQSEAIGKTAVELGLFESRKVRDDLIDQFVKCGKIRDFELQVVLKDGTVLTGLFSMDQLVSEGNELLISSFVDITEQKKNEQTVYESEMRLELALKGANQGLWDWNIKTGYVYFNERWETMLGFDPGEVEPNVSSWEKLVHPDEMPIIMSTLQKHLDGETPYYRTEHRMKTKDGRNLLKRRTGSGQGSRHQRKNLSRQKK